MRIDNYFSNLPEYTYGLGPWEILANLESKIGGLVHGLGDEYAIKGDVAIHLTATVEVSSKIKGPAIIGPRCFIGPHSLIRGGVHLVSDVTVGPSCEIKHSLVGANTAFAHFNFIGDSIVGSGVNLEAGAVIANYYNERSDKTVEAYIDGNVVETGLTKLGALIGDGTKIGANAVTSPGTVLQKNSIVKRLELIEQYPND